MIPLSGYISSRETKPPASSQIFFGHYLYGSQQQSREAHDAILTALATGEVNQLITGAAPLRAALGWHCKHYRTHGVQGAAQFR